MKILTKLCIVCGKEYVKPSLGCSYKRWAERKYCSHQCALKGFIPWCTGKKGIRLSIQSEFKNGHTPWHKGTKGIKKGRPWTPEERLLIAERFRGSKSHFWKGGISKENYRLRRTAQYKNWRKAVFERDDYTCQNCGKRGGRLNSHHISSWQTHPELRFEVSNGQTLCLPCHIRTDSYAKNLKTM